MGLALVHFQIYWLLRATQKPGRSLPPTLPGVWQGTDAIYTSEFNNIKIVLITFKELTTQSNTALSLGT